MTFASLPRLAQSFLRYIFHDEVRLFELFSALNLLAWTEVLLAHPGLFDTEIYRGFNSHAAVFWAYCFGAIAVSQIAATIVQSRLQFELRYVAMALAAGAWAVIAWNFWQSSISTTANLNYSLLALGCAISGAFLGWKSTSYQS